MTREVCPREFVNTLMPLFSSDVTEDDLTNIYNQSSLKCTASSEEFIAISARKNILKRTVFILPKKQAFYITLKKADLAHINNNLKLIQQNKQLRRVLGTFALIGFTRKRGCVNTCNPMIRVDLSARPAFKVMAKVTRVVTFENRLIASQEAKRKINEEMRYREDYKDDPNTPKIEYHGFYTGYHNENEENEQKKVEAGKNKKCLKHLEICELLPGDLFDIIHSKSALIRKYFNFRNSDRFSILSQVLKFLNRLHDDTFVYGDMKPENIYIKRGEEQDKYIAKVGDFGYLAERHKLRGTNGTETYWSPEHIRYEFTQNPNDQIEIGFATDIWCFGWVIVHLFQLERPEWHQKMHDFLESRSWTTYLKYLQSLDKYQKRPYPSSGSLQEQLLWHCWRSEPKDRMKTDELMDLLVEKADFRSP